MSLTWLDSSTDSRFPPVEQALDNGLLAAGGDLSASRLMTAYQQGIFPWFDEHQPILWWSPDPRMVLLTKKIKISRSLTKTLRKTDITVTIDHDFYGVITACAAPRDTKKHETWIHQDIISAYTDLHEQGVAHSIECWQQKQLVGGLYGIAIGQVFFGESMFSKKRDSSKIALVALCQQLDRWQIPIIDCQIYSDHLASMGATEMARRDFISLINQKREGVQAHTWQLDADLPLAP